MSQTFKPETPEQVLEAVSWALAEEQSLDVAGSGSKAALGRPAETDNRLDMAAIAGIVLYEPEELVLTARAGTSMAEIEAALAEKDQQLAFEPGDLGPLLGAVGGSSNVSGTLGGVVACNIAGSRRVKVGAARDHLLGFHAVSGWGEGFKSGGRVVKNVTGFDLSKLITGSFGTLAVMTEVTVRALPAPEKTRTVLVFGCADDTAVRAMTAALQTPYEVSGATHLPADIAATSKVAAVAAAGGAVTAVRVEGPGPSVEFRCGALRDLMAPFGEVEELHSANSLAFWREVRDVAYFAGAGERQVWRLSVPPADGARVAEQVLSAIKGHVFYDWGGGLVWLALAPSADAGHDAVRAAISATGGHATLVRAEDALRAKVPVFQPQPGPLAALTRRIKQGFDPKGVLNPGRMYEGV
jgi:glycolate oxidase FAD binding subunit